MPSSSLPFGLLDAFKLASRLHTGRVDLAGRPYIEHLVRVFLRVLARGCDRDQLFAALLHDSVEDGLITPEGLIAEGVPPRSVRLVVTLTRPAGVTYMEYIAIVKQDPSSVPIKEEDLCDNLDPARLSVLDPARAVSLRARYQKALKFLIEE